MQTFSNYKSKLNETIKADKTIIAELVDEIKLADDALLRTQEYDRLVRKNNRREFKINNIFKEEEDVAWGLISKWSKHLLMKVNNKFKKTEMINFIVSAKRSPLEKAEMRDRLTGEHVEVIEQLFKKEFLRQKLILKITSMTPEERAEFLKSGSKMSKAEKELLLKSI